ncbi:RDD family protein [Anatilimnocola sp. NA78]|uniref:RDD family protein n=1 Tax=Anatilimnocola sp. NA78 TaxID=3415683 RepID=UPI003CE578F0
MPEQRSSKESVYYAQDDYLGMGTRLGILVIDSLVLLFLFALMTVPSQLIAPQLQGLFTLAWMLLVWFYEVPLKRSKLRTVAYNLLRCKIVNLQGEPPSLFALTLRLFLGMFGPWVLGFDILWCGIDKDCQGLRDCLAGTCLVREHALPVGAGPVGFCLYFTMGCIFLYPRVIHPEIVQAVLVAELDSAA